MTSITRHDPFSDLDDLFRGFMLHPVRMEGVQQPSIRMDVREDDQGYTVHAEMPGIRKEDLSITVDGSMVTITGEVKAAREEKKHERVIHSERYHGSVSRSFSVAQAIDRGAATARFEDGVLALRLPKSSGSRSNRIEVA